MNGNGSQPQVYDGNTQVSVTLPLVTWNTICAIVAEAPWKTADPLMKEIQRQLTQNLETTKGLEQPELRQ